MRNEVLDRPLWFLNARYQCNAAFMSKLTWLTEPTSFNVMAAFAMKIVGRWWILSGISLKSENFLQTAPRLQAVDLHRLWAHVFASDSSSENLLNQAKHTVLFTELSCGYADRGAVVFTSHANSDQSAPLETLSRVFRFYLALSGMMPAYSCNHMLDSSVAPKIVYWTAYGCIEFCNLVAYNCTHVSLTIVQSCFETILLQNWQAQQFQESFS